MEIKIDKKANDIFNLYLNGEYIRTCIDKEGILNEIKTRVEEL